MGKIDFMEQQRQREMAEAKAEMGYSEDMGDTSGYNGTWGTNKEEIKNIDLAMIVPFKNKKGKKQPFVLSEERVKAIKTSAADIGIITPLIVRLTDKGYQILSGHHRFQAAKELKMTSVPCIVRNISDEEAEKYVVEANIQRLKFLPSEYAAIIDRYLELKHDLDLTVEEIAEKFNISSKTLYRYAALSQVTEQLRELFDADMINIDCVDALKTLTQDQQDELAQVIRDTGKKIALSKATSIVVLFNEGRFSQETFTDLYAKPRAQFKNKLYQKIFSTRQTEMEEADVDALVEMLLINYLEGKGTDV